MKLSHKELLVAGWLIQALEQRRLSSCAHAGYHRYYTVMAICSVAQTASNGLYRIFREIREMPSEVGLKPTTPRTSFRSLSAETGVFLIDLEPSTANRNQCSAKAAIPREYRGNFSKVAAETLLLRILSRPHFQK